jgi:hypothetical protein
MIERVTSVWMIDHLADSFSLTNFGFNGQRAFFIRIFPASFSCSTITNFGFPIEKSPFLAFKDQIASWSALMEFGTTFWMRIGESNRFLGADLREN